VEEEKMQTERELAFQIHEPKLTEEETLDAFVRSEVALSLKALPCISPTGIVEYVAVKFALQNGDTPTVLLDRFAAGAFLAVIDSMNQVGWDGTVLRAGPMSH
jgi:hypothetical protein